MRSFTHLLTYLYSWLCAYKTGNISETVEDRAKATITAYIKSYAAKMHDLGPLSEIQSQLEILIIELWQFFPDLLFFFMILSVWHYIAYIVLKCR